MLAGSEPGSQMACPLTTAGAAQRLATIKKVLGLKWGKKWNALAFNFNLVSPVTVLIFLANHYSAMNERQVQAKYSTRTSKP
jgi:hypothetical protein